MERTKTIHLCTWTVAEANNACFRCKATCKVNNPNNYLLYDGSWSGTVRTTQEFIDQELRHNRQICSLAVLHMFAIWKPVWMSVHSNLKCVCVCLDVCCMPFVQSVISRWEWFKNEVPITPQNCSYSYHVDYSCFKPSIFSGHIFDRYPNRTKALWRVYASSP